MSTQSPQEVEEYNREQRRANKAVVSPVESRLRANANFLERKGWSKSAVLEREAVAEIELLRAALTASEKQAARYGVLRLHSTPIHVCESMNIECTDLPKGQGIAERIDELCDAILAKGETK